MGIYTKNGFVRLVIFRLIRYWYWFMAAYVSNWWILLD